MIEAQFIEQVLLDQSGAIVEPMRQFFERIDYIGYQYKHQNGGLYYMNASGDSWRGLGDTEGRYAYFRYMTPQAGHQMDKNTVSVWITVAMAFNVQIDAVHAGLLVMDYLREAKSPLGKVTAFSPLRSNRVLVWVEESGLPAEKVRTDVAMASFDFQLRYPAPDSCEIPSFTCQN